MERKRTKSFYGSPCSYVPFISATFVYFSNSTEHSTKVKSFMLDVLCPLITESDVVSNELLNVILMNLVEPNKREHKHAYALAKELIVKTNETLEPYIQAVSCNT